MARLDRVPATGKAGKVGPRAGRRGGHRISPGLHLRFRPARAAADEHGVGDVLGWPGSGRRARRGLARGCRAIGTIAARRVELKFVGDPGLCRRQRLDRAASSLTGNGHQRAVAAEHEGQVPRPSALSSAEMTLAPAMLTGLVAPAWIALVEPTMSAVASAQSSGRGR